MEPVQIELRRVFPDFPFRPAPTPGSSGDAPQPDIRLAFTARFLKKSAERNGGGLQLAVQYAIAYHHAHEKHDQHRQGGKTSRCPGQDVAALGTPRKADSGGPNGQQPLSRGAEPEAEPETAGNRNGPTRGESVRQWRRCGGDRPRRSRESHACQIRRWSTGHVGAGREPCALLRTFLIAGENP